MSVSGSTKKMYIIVRKIERVGMWGNTFDIVSSKKNCTPEVKETWKEHGTNTFVIADISENCSGMALSILVNMLKKKKIITGFNSACCPQDRKNINSEPHHLFCSLLSSRLYHQCNVTTLGILKCTT